MKIIQIILILTNILSCCGTVLYVLKDIIHNKDTSIFINAIMLSSVVVSLLVQRKLYNILK
jgi:hypothetical protein|nr:MAG TPA: hypothetical protein [Caudoviricetes sp.]